MTVILETNNQVTAILNDDDLKLIASAKEYYQQMVQRSQDLIQTTQQQCTALRSQTEQECEQLKQQLAQQTEAKLEQLSQQLQQENQQLLADCLTSIEDGVFELCYKILTKLHLTTVNRGQLAALVKDELLALIDNGNLTVRANQENIELLQATIDDAEVKIKYIVDPHLGPTQCQLSNQVSQIYVDLESCKQQILELLATPKPEQA